MDLEQRFLRHVEKTDGCWLWTGARLAVGYGSFQMGRGVGSRSTHRVAYELWIGPIGDLCVLHRCDVRLCVRPDHLVLGTRTENMEDKVSKRRQQRAFTDKQAKEIRLRYANGETARDLAAEFGVSRNTVGNLVAGRLYKYVA